MIQRFKVLRYERLLPDTLNLRNFLIIAQSKVSINTPKIVLLPVVFFAFGLNLFRHLLLILLCVAFLR